MPLTERSEASTVHSDPYREVETILGVVGRVLRVRGEDGLSSRDGGGMTVLPLDYLKVAPSTNRAGFPNTVFSSRSSPMVYITKEVLSSPMSACLASNRPPSDRIAAGQGHKSCSEGMSERISRRDQGAAGGAFDPGFFCGPLLNDVVSPFEKIVHALDVKPQVRPHFLMSRLSVPVNPWTRPSIQSEQGG
jgi:hypothetical protein